MAEPVTSPRRLRAAERHVAALELRKAGATYDEIAKALGYRTRSAAYKAIDTILQQTAREPADEVRRLELARLDFAQRAIWQRVRQGDVHAIDRLLKIMDRRAAYLGLDAPIRAHVISEDAIDAEIKKLETELAGQDT